MEQSSIEQKRIAVIEEILTAFEGVQREDGITLHEAQALDNYGEREERNRARAMDTETRWQDVPTEDISRGDNVLSFLDPKGFRYYFPAYLIWYLTSEDDSNTYDSILCFLADDPTTKYDRYYLSRLALLTLEQCKAIAHFLLFVAEQAERRKIEQEKEITLELEEQLNAKVASGQISPKQCDEARKTLWRLLKHHTRNYARSGLYGYWGQFLS